MGTPSREPRVEIYSAMVMEATPKHQTYLKLSVTLGSSLCNDSNCGLSVKANACSLRVNDLKHTSKIHTAKTPIKMNLQCKFTLNKMHSHK